MNNTTTEIKAKSLIYLYLMIFSGIVLISAIIFVLLVYVFKVLAVNDILVFSTNTLNSTLLLYVFVGFVAQMIDGTLGMAYGVSSTSFLISTGITPAVASASVHASEIFTTGISGLSHWRFKNLNKKLFVQLMIPGVVGAVLGAYVLSSFDGDFLKPYITVYLLLMGGRILYKAFKKRGIKKSLNPVSTSVLGLVGGFVDASGGGGWGPVVTTTLIGTGENPKKTIGTVNTAEFLVTVASSSVFTMLIGLSHWNIIIGLIIGGIMAAPLAAFLCHKINTRWAMILVGLLIIGLSIRTLLKLFL